MPASKFKLTIEAGTTFKLVVACKDAAQAPVDLTGYTAAAQVRSDYNSDTSVIFTCVITGNQIDLTLPPSESIKLQSFEEGVWDLRLTAPDGTVSRLLKGAVIVLPAVTR